MVNNERPILFSGEMVRAILDGRKTQTRRVIKAKVPCWNKPDDWQKGICFHGMVSFNNGPSKQHQLRDFSVQCPYGIPCDRLWVRETWQNTADMGICHPADNYVVYRATDPDWETMEGWKWRPSIFMPREASRITLEITDIRVERVQDISEKDAEHEGLTEWQDFIYLSPDESRMTRDIIQAFSWLWDSLNAKRGYSWESNPWVWVIDFKKIKEGSDGR